MRRKSTFTAAAKRDAVMCVLTKRKTVTQTCRELGLSENTFACWKEKALEGMEATLVDKDNLRSLKDVLAKQLAEDERTIGQFALDKELPGKASRRLR